MQHLCLCVAVAIGTLGAVLCIISRHGHAVQLCSSAYVINLTLTQLLMAALSSRPFLYRYPACVTVLHFLACWLFSVAYWAAAGDLGKCRPRSLGPGGRFAREVLPIALTLPVAVACNNAALLYIGVGLNSVLGALTPVATALLSLALGRAARGAAWLGLAVALVGAVLVSVGEARAGSRGGGALARGACLSLAAVALRALKSVLQDRVLNAAEYRRGEGKEPLAPREPVSPMHLWALQAPPMALVSLAYALCTESLPGALRHLSPQNAALIMATCASATALNITGAMTIRALGASLMQAVGKLNVIVTVAFSVALLGEVLPLKVVIGAAIMLAGILIFERAEDWAARPSASAAAPQAKV